MQACYKCSCSAMSTPAVAAAAGLHDSLLRACLPLAPAEQAKVQVQVQPGGPEPEPEPEAQLLWGGLPWPTTYPAQRTACGGLCAAVLCGCGPVSQAAGAATATAYRAISEVGCPDTVFVCVSSSSGGEGVAVNAAVSMDTVSWPTPLGAVRCDSETSQQLRAVGLAAATEGDMAAAAPALAAQCPFIWHLSPDYSSGENRRRSERACPAVVVVVVGYGERSEQQAAQAMVSVIQARQQRQRQRQRQQQQKGRRYAIVAVIASSDSSFAVTAAATASAVVLPAESTLQQPAVAAAVQCAAALGLEPLAALAPAVWGCFPPAASSSSPSSSTAGWQPGSAVLLECSWS